MKGVELYGRVRYAVQIEGLSHREAARQFGIASDKVVKFSVPTHSKLSTIGVPLGGVTAKATASAPFSDRMASGRSAISVRASSQEISTQPGSPYASNRRC
jgi:hypothetical protein